MPKCFITPATLQFLSELRDNNNRPWFETNKHRYDLVKKEAKGFLSGIEVELSKTDDIEKTKLFRIYRDVRFSHDKTPYNYHVSMSLSRQKPYLRGGYFLRIMPQGSLLACGFWNPNTHDLALIRSHIATDSNRMRKAINSPDLIRTLGKLEGDQVKTAPKGYSKDHPEINMLRYKQFLFSRHFTDQEVVSSDFFDQVIDGFLSVRPFFDYMSDILTHNLNGEPLY